MPGCQPTLFTQQERSHENLSQEETMAVNETDADRLFARPGEKESNGLFVKTPIEFGMTGER